MRVLVIGAGAVGSLIGARFALSQHDVTLVGRSSLKAAVEFRGLSLVTPDGAAQITHPRVTENVADTLRDLGRFDIAFLTVKTYDTATVIEQLAPVAERLPPLVSLQNGIGNEEALAAAFGADRIVAGAIDTPVSMPAPGQVQVHRDRYCVGVAPVGVAPVAQAAEALAAGGFDVETYRDHRGLKWSKLLFNLLANATCAILDWTPAQVMSHPISAEIEARAWQEALNAMAALGIRPVNLAGYPLAPFAPLARRLSPAWLGLVLSRFVSGGRGSKMPSLYIALADGKRTEVEWLNGAVARAGVIAHVPTPVNDTLTDLVLALTAGREERAAWRGRADRLAAQLQIRPPL